MSQSQSEGYIPGFEESGLSQQAMDAGATASSCQTARASNSATDCQSAEQPVRRSRASSARVDRAGESRRASG
jgi:hypothetical protein